MSRAFKEPLYRGIPQGGFTIDRGGVKGLTEADYLSEANLVDRYHGTHYTNESDMSIVNYLAADGKLHIKHSVIPDTTLFPTLKGPTSGRKDNQLVWDITNFGFDRDYKPQTDYGNIRIVDDKLYFTPTVAGPVSFKVGDREIELQILDYGIGSPRIRRIGYSKRDADITVESTDFQVFEGEDTHKASSWSVEKIINEVGATTPFLSINDSETDKLLFTREFREMGKFSFKALHIGAKLGKGPWGSEQNWGIPKAIEGEKIGGVKGTSETIAVSVTVPANTEVTVTGSTGYTRKMTSSGIVTVPVGQIKVKITGKGEDGQTIKEPGQPFIADVGSPEYPNGVGPYVPEVPAKPAVPPSGPIYITIPAVPAVPPSDPIYETVTTHHPEEPPSGPIYETRYREETTQGSSYGVKTSSFTKPNQMAFGVKDNIVVPLSINETAMGQISSTKLAAAASLETHVGNHGRATLISEQSQIGDITDILKYTTTRGLTPGFESRVCGYANFLNVDYIWPLPYDAIRYGSSLGMTTKDLSLGNSYEKIYGTPADNSAYGGNLSYVNKEGLVLRTDILFPRVLDYTAIVHLQPNLNPTGHNTGRYSRETFFETFIGGRDSERFASTGTTGVSMGLPNAQSFYNLIFKKLNPHANTTDAPLHHGILRLVKGLGTSAFDAGIGPWKAHEPRALYFNFRFNLGGLVWTGDSLLKFGDLKSVPSYAKGHILPQTLSSLPAAFGFNRSAVVSLPGNITVLMAMNVCTFSGTIKIPYQHQTGWTNPGKPAYTTTERKITSYKNPGSPYVPARQEQVGWKNEYQPPVPGVPAKNDPRYPQGLPPYVKGQDYIAPWDRIITGATASASFLGETYEFPGGVGKAATAREFEKVVFEDTSSQLNFGTYVHLDETGKILTVGPDPRSRLAPIDTEEGISVFTVVPVHMGSTPPSVTFRKRLFAPQEEKKLKLEIPTGGQISIKFDEKPATIYNSSQTIDLPSFVTDMVMKGYGGVGKETPQPAQEYVPQKGIARYPDGLLPYQEGRLAQPAIGNPDFPNGLDPYSGPGGSVPEVGDKNHLGGLPKYEPAKPAVVGQGDPKYKDGLPPYEPYVAPVPGIGPIYASDIVRVRGFGTKVIAKFLGRPKAGVTIRSTRAEANKLVDNENRNKRLANYKYPHPDAALFTKAFKPVPTIDVYIYESDEVEEVFENGVSQGYQVYVYQYHGIFGEDTEIEIETMRQPPEIIGYKTPEVKEKAMVGSPDYPLGLVPYIPASDAKPQVGDPNYPDGLLPYQQAKEGVKESGDPEFPLGLPPYVAANPMRGDPEFPDGLNPYQPSTPGGVGQGDPNFPEGLTAYQAAIKGQGDENYPTGLLPYIPGTQGAQTQGDPNFPDGLPPYQAAVPAQGNPLFPNGLGPYTPGAAQGAPIYGTKTETITIAPVKAGNPITKEVSGVFNGPVYWGAVVAASQTSADNSAAIGMLNSTITLPPEVADTNGLRLRIFMPIASGVATFKGNGGKDYWIQSSQQGYVSRLNTRITRIERETWYSADVLSQDYAFNPGGIGTKPTTWEAELLNVFFSGTDIIGRVPVTIHIKGGHLRTDTGVIGTIGPNNVLTGSQRYNLQVVLTFKDRPGSSFTKTVTDYNNIIGYNPPGSSGKGDPNHPKGYPPYKPGTPQVGDSRYPRGLPPYVPGGSPTAGQGDPNHPNGLPPFIRAEPAKGNPDFPFGLPIYIPDTAPTPQIGDPKYPDGIEPYSPATNAIGNIKHPNGIGPYIKPSDAKGDINHPLGYPKYVPAVEEIPFVGNPEYKDGFPPYEPAIEARPAGFLREKGESARLTVQGKAGNTEFLFDGQIGTQKTEEQHSYVNQKEVITTGKHILTRDGQFVFATSRVLNYSASNKRPVYVFRNSSGAFNYFATVTLPEEIFDYDFGESLAASSDGSILYVGAPGQGALFVFKQSGTNWNYTATLAAPDLSNPGVFSAGLDCSTDGSKLYVGAPTIPTTNGNTGRVYEYTTVDFVSFNETNVFSAGSDVLTYSYDIPAGGRLIVTEYNGTGGQIASVTLTGKGNRSFNSNVARMRLRGFGELKRAGLPATMEHGSLTYTFASTGSATEKYVEYNVPFVKKALAFGTVVKSKNNRLFIGAPETQSSYTNQGIVFSYKYGTNWSEGFKVGSTDPKMDGFFGKNIDSMTDGRIFVTGDPIGNGGVGEIGIHTESPGSPYITFSTYLKETGTAKGFGDGAAISGNGVVYLATDPEINSLGRVDVF